MVWVTNLDALKSMFGLDVTMIGDLNVDVLVSESPIYEFELTEHPVDSGLPISDARTAKPVGVILECIFTDPDLAASSIGKAALSGTLNFESWTTKYEKLKALKDSDTLIDILTPLDLYTSMSIVRVAPERTAQKASALFVTVEARRVRIIESATSAVPLDKIPKDKVEETKKTNKAKAPKKVEPKKAPAAATPKDKSILSGLADKLSGMFG